MRLLHLGLSHVYSPSSTAVFAEAAELRPRSDRCWMYVTPHPCGLWLFPDSDRDGGGPKLMRGSQEQVFGLGFYSMLLDGRIALPKLC